jgi:hypothetical protein
VRRHDTDVTSLVFGLVFVGMAAIWALVQSDLLSLPDLSVVGPAVLVVAGVIGLAATLRGSARSRRPDEPEEHTEPVESAPAAPEEQTELLP